MTELSADLSAPDPGLGAAIEVADWRRRIGDLYCRIREHKDPEVAWELWCFERNRLFSAHPQSPIPPDQQTTYSGPPVFAYDGRWRFTVNAEPLQEADSFLVDLGLDGVLPLTAVARTSGLGAVLGTELTLYWMGGYAGGLFLPFTDGTSGRESYGGGRYLIDSRKGADLGTAGNRLVLDFNFAYHPSCCYAPEFTCPLAPAENRVTERITAGERL